MEEKRAEVQKVIKRCLGKNQADLEGADHLNEALYHSYTRVSLGLRGQLSPNSTKGGKVKVHSIKAAIFENIIEEDWISGSGTHSVSMFVNGKRLGQ